MINTATKKVENTIEVGEWPSHIVFKPDGNVFFVTNQISQTLSVIDTATSDVRSIPLQFKPHTIVASLDGSRLYVGAADRGLISVMKI
ncbi:hypothetical protein HU724_008460 [Pseudomonas iranensis]|uniref:YncE family protein n=1 Tax=Pseudomonas iranensis TaxID=2745503 RepID=UPI001647E85F|nr:hypothetical protein [Pseudomonas iranensis]QXI24298.1 hypothetical protein HU724_008460 [Pseudomonas iranensis]